MLKIILDTNLNFSYNIFSLSERTKLLRPIQRPDTCPSCESPLEWVSPQLFCINSDCDAQTSKKIEHFAKALKIKGLGPATIDKLSLDNISGIYALDEDVVAEVLSSEKIASKLIAEIENSEKAPLELLLPAFSITLIGKTAANKLSSVCNNIYEINEHTCKEAGLGPKATEHLLSWLENDFEDLKFSLPQDFNFSKSTNTPKIGVVCISGKLKSFKNKADATVSLEAAGFQVKSSVTKDVTHLVNESGIETAKTEKARNSGVIIIDNLKSFLEE